VAESAPESRKLTPAKVKNTTLFHSMLHYVHPAWGNTKTEQPLSQAGLRPAGQTGQKTGQPGKQRDGWQS